MLGHDYLNYTCRVLYTTLDFVAAASLMKGKIED